MGKAKCKSLNLDIFTGRFEVYFFLYFIGYVLVWRLNNEYIAAKYIHSLNIAGRLSFNVTTLDVNGLIVPYVLTDIDSNYCNATNLTTTQAHETAKDIMKGVERETLKVYTTLLVPSITVTILYGLISDFTGKRKFMMSLSSFSNAMYAMIIILDFYTRNDMGLKNMFIGAFIAGCFGNWAATTVALTTYIADVTKPKERFLRMGIVIVLMKLVYAAIDGPLIHWIHTRGFQQPIWVAFAAAGLACSLQIQVMEESQATNRDYKEFNLILFLSWLITTKFRKVFDRYFIFLVISYSCMEFISEGYYIRLIHATYGVLLCNSSEVFSFIHYVAWNIFGVIGLIIVFVPIVRKIPDAILAIIGLVSIAAGLIFLPFCSQEWMFYTAFAMMVLHEVPYAVFLTLASKHTDSETQAIALTFLYCCGGISKLLALLLNHFLFYETGGTFQINNNLMWIHASLLIFPAIFLILLWKTGDKSTEQNKIVYLNGNVLTAAEEDSHSNNFSSREKLK